MLAGRYEGHSNSMTISQSNLDSEFKLSGYQQSENAILLTYEHEALKLKIQSQIELNTHSDMFRQTNSIENTGDEPITVTHFSSALLGGIGDYELSLCKHHDCFIHYFDCTWEGEMQHVCKSLSEIMLLPVSVHQMTKSFRIRSEGSYTTSRVIPTLFFEDKTMDKIWVMSMEAEGNFSLESGYLAKYLSAKGGYYLECSSISLRQNNFAKTLQPKERYTASSAIFGSTNGSLEEAIKELTAFRRNTYKKSEPPLVYNDYMNCLWGQPSKEKLIPLIDRAKEIGAEAFCIDAGWYGEIGLSWGKKLGDWNPSKTLFGKEGLQGIFDYIKSQGLIIGIWMEMEVCGEEAEAFKFPDNYFLMRYGKRIGGEERCFFDFTNSNVREYLKDKVKTLYDMGVRYIKNDYNDCIGNGCDNIENPIEGLIQNHRCAMNFYEELMSNFRGLQIENCGSGGMRCDYGTLKHFNLQSTSDQEFYTLYPSIVQGSLANILPEQAGIWCYPYPHLFDERGDEKTLLIVRENCKDGRQTVFNMVNGLAGVLYLSGRIDYADEGNLTLIKEGVKIYKNLRNFKRNCSAVYPNGFKSIFDDRGYVILGLNSEETLLLFVWKLQGGDQDTVIPLHKYLEGDNTDISLCYPSVNPDLQFIFDKNMKNLKVQLFHDNTAQIFQINKKI